jgi:hypothetical protein
MTSPQCEYCGHVNPAGAGVCESCDFPLGADRATGEGVPPGEPSWTAPDTSGTSGAWPPADAIPSPPFKSASDVISPMLAVYRKHFTLIGILVLVATIPEALIRYGVVDFRRARFAVAGAGMGFTSVQGWLLWLLAMGSASLLAGSLIYAVVDLQRAASASAGECLSRGLKAWPRVFVLTLLYVLIVMAGYVLLIVPGVVLSLMFAVCVPVAVIEGLGPIAALKRSYALTSGYKGLIFITTFLWGLLILVLNWIVIWSFARGAKLDLLPTLLLQTAVLGMLNSSAHVLNVYVYLGLLRERRSGFRADAFTQGPEGTAG